MKSINHLLGKLSFAATEYGNITCVPTNVTSPPAPNLFVDIEDVIALKASGPFGSFFFHELKNNNYCLSHDQYSLLEDISLTTCAETQSLGLHYVLKNSLHSMSPNRREDLMLKNQYNMIYVPSIESKYFFQKAHEYTNFGVVFAPEYLDRCSEAFPFLSGFLKRVSRKVPALLRHQHANITPEMTLAIQSILNCGYAGTLKKMYLDSKVPELLLLSLQNIPNGNARRLTLTRTDLQRIHQAREYLQMHMDEPCSIQQLAHEVGLNDFKIKNGFKQVYKNTVFGVFLEDRMQRARMLLLETDLSIAEISVLTGYKNLSNFTVAFKRKFGYTPSSLKH